MEFFNNKRCILFAQSDYAARLKEYLRLIAPELRLVDILMPLTTEKPDKTEFFFEAAFSACRDINSEDIILVGFSMKYHEIIKTFLQEKGYFNLVFYTSELDNELKKDYLKLFYAAAGKSFEIIYDYHDVLAKEPDAKVYMAKCVVDKKIGVDDSLGRYVVPIQVGAALTDQRIADCTDDIGDNISLRNRRYSEMTAFYWMWKNDASDIVGICHYRRHWVRLEEIIEKMVANDVDVVLPLPTLCEKNVFEDYLLKHIPDVWPTMMQVLEELSPEYYEASKEIFQGKIFYASNMCILKRNVLEDLCRWMFPIVFEIEKRVGDLSDVYYNRYAGFCTERLITLYFIHNSKKWRIAHGEKIFIG